MKKLIYLILFIPFIGFGQTYPHQIEPDTTHRMIMMTDTSVIDSPAMEFLYFSIDSLVEQIARDTLGLDSTYWSLDDSLSLSPVNQTNNIILGNLSGNRSLTGSYNFIAGNGLGNSLTTGNYNFLINGGNDLTTGSNNSFIGQLSGFYQTGSHNIGLGSASLLGQSGLSTGSNNIGLGNGSLNNLTTGLGNVALGFRSGYSNESSNYNLFLGYNSGYNIKSANNVSLGYNALYGQSGLSTGVANLGLGASAGFSITTGERNSFIGSSAGFGVTTGSHNFYGGFQSGYYNSSGGYNIGIGYRALYGQSGLSTGSYNLALGEQSLRNNTTGNNNLGLGYRSFYINSTGTGNVGIGRESGYLNTGNYSVFIGYQAGYNETGSNKLYIENSNISTPLIYGEFDNDLVRINGSLEVSDKTGTAGNFAAFDGDKIVDSGISTTGDPDQTLSFSDPDLTISGTGGNTIDISGVNYWDTNADGIYTLDNVGINTTPHATHPLYVVGTMWLDGPVRDGNGNFSGGTGNIMTANSGGEFLWESPSNISLSEFNNDLGLTQYWSLVGSDLFSNTGGAARDIIVGEIDMELPISGTPDQLMGRISSTGILNDINIGSGLSLSSGTLSATATSSPWTDNGLYVSTTNNEDVYIAAGESIGLATTIPSSSYQIDGDTDSAVRLRGDLYDKNSSNGASGDVLMSDGDQIVWVTKGSAQLEDALESTSSTTYVDLNFTSGGSWGITGSTTTDDFSIPYTGVYKLIASGGNSSTGQCIVQFERNGTGIYELNIGTGHDQNNSGTFTPAAFSFHYIASFTAGDDITMAFKAGTNTCVLDDIVFSIETMSVVGGI